MPMPVIHTHDDAEAAAAEKWLDQLDPATVKPRDASRVRAIIAASEALAAAEENLRQAVAEARAAGDTWTVIGAALGTTKQAAHERFRSSVER
jgi:dihydroxyacetone kinase